MIYVIYVVAGLFIALAFAMLYVFYRSSHFGMFVIGLTYGCSGLLAMLLGHWWPLLAGFILIWLLKLLGLEIGDESKGGGPNQGG